MVGENMQFIYGSLGTVVFFSCLIGAYMVGRRSRHPTPSKVKGADEEARRKAEKIREGFEQLMSYDVTTAIKGKG